jgi:hygromycin-B 7''-O-kinase
MANLAAIISCRRPGREIAEIPMPDLQPEPLAQLDTPDGYRRLFVDAAFWAPCVQTVCARHSCAPCTHIRSGLPGTCPTFIVDDRWVVKFFGRLFDGPQSYLAESSVAGSLADKVAIPAPALLASGELSPDAHGWSWPYLVYAYVPGVSAGEAWEAMVQADRLALAGQMAVITRRLHALPLPPARTVRVGDSHAAWPEAYVEFLARRRTGCAAARRAWGSLPDRLLGQIEEFLPPMEALFPAGAAPHLIHADLTADHVLGRLEGGRWTTLALIDFGDAMAGSLLYELVALHLGLFHADKALLAAYLAAYDPSVPADPRFPACALAFTLLHRFDVLAEVLERYPAARSSPTLDDLARLLWDVDAPGVAG